MPAKVRNKLEHTWYSNIFKGLQILKFIVYLIWF